METRQLCGVTDIAIWIIRKKVEDIKAGFFGKLVRDNRPMARFGITFKAKKTGRRSLHGFRQFRQSALRVVSLDVIAVDRAEKVKLTGTRGIPAWFGISEGDEMDVVDAFIGEAFGQFLLRKPCLAGNCDCPHISKLPDTSRLQSPDEPINVGPFISNCE